LAGADRSYGQGIRTAGGKPTSGELRLPGFGPQVFVPEGENPSRGVPPLEIPMQNPGQEKFIERFEKATMQYVILAKAKQGEVTKESLQQTFKGNLQALSPHFESCIRTLVSDGHLREVGNKYTITDDGREDVQKLQSIAIELPNVISGGQQRPGVPAGAQGSLSGANVGGQPGSQGSPGSRGQGR